jgi:hypothetical protein
VTVVLADDAACAVPTRADADAALVADTGVVWVKVRETGRMPSALAAAVASFTAEQARQAYVLLVREHSLASQHLRSDQQWD